MFDSANTEDDGGSLHGKVLPPEKDTEEWTGWVHVQHTRRAFRAYTSLSMVYSVVGFSPVVDMFINWQMSTCLQLNFSDRRGLDAACSEPLNREAAARKASGQ